MKHCFKLAAVAVLASASLSANANADIPGTFSGPSNLGSNIALAGAFDYGLSVNVQFNKSLELIVGTDGVGADLAFWHYDLLPQSRFFSQRPLTFYVSGGLGYAWDDTNDVLEGTVVRSPAGADWLFAPKWSVYASLAPTINFVKEQKSNGHTHRDSDVKFQMMSTVGIRYHF